MRSLTEIATELDFRGYWRIRSYYYYYYNYHLADGSFTLVAPICDVSGECFSRLTNHNIHDDVRGRLTLIT